MGKTFKDPAESRWAKEMKHDRLRASAARHPNIALTVIAGADHAMATSVAAADPIDPVLSTREAPQSAEYFGLLGAWLTRHGVARSP